jgi:23S rRNA maturation-related 3'-5' exoribonuclease YhaM
MTEKFEQEIELIKNPAIKNIAKQGVDLLPDYFFKVPASSTGKYHPSFALGEGGLYRHVRAAVGIAVELFRIYDFAPDEQDIIITSLMLHDGWKQGLDGSGNTTHSHPIVASDVLRTKVHVNGPDDERVLAMICDSISSHMGQWSTSKWDSTVLPTPKTEIQKFVHLSDYLASRKALEYNFEAR